MKKLAIITTHPIQYNAPLFKMLAQRGKIEIKVFYTWGNKVLQNKYDPGFGKNIEWDIPLDGYDHCFVQNTSTSPGSHHFNGIKNPTLIKEIESWDPSAVFVYGWNFHSHLKCIRYFHKKLPVFFRGDSTLTDEKPGIRTLARQLFLKWVYSYINKAFYTGTANRKYFEKHGLKGNRLAFMPHAVDNDRFVANTDTRIIAGVLKGKMHIPENDIVFLFAGKLEEKKAPIFLAKSFSLLTPQNKHLVFVGNGVLENELKKNYASATNIHFIDFQNQSMMPAVYQVCDVFVLPSKGPGESWGLSINEAMASGKPVLVSEACGAAMDLVENAVNGFVFKKNDEPGLLKKMQLLASDKQQLSKMGKRSLEIIKDWSYEKDCEAIESAL